MWMWRIFQVNNKKATRPGLGEGDETFFFFYAEFIRELNKKADLVSRFLSLPHQGGCGQSFEAKIVSPLFAKKTTLARHRLVNAALKTEIAAIHAWTPRCFTPEEWERKRADAGVGS